MYSSYDTLKITNFPNERCESDRETDREERKKKEKERASGKPHLTFISNCRSPLKSIIIWDSYTQGNNRHRTVTETSHTYWWMWFRSQGEMCADKISKLRSKRERRYTMTGFSDLRVGFKWDNVHSWALAFSRLIFTMFTMWKWVGCAKWKQKA